MMDPLEKLVTEARRSGALEFQFENAKRALLGRDVEIENLTRMRDQQAHTIRNLESERARLYADRDRAEGPLKQLHEAAGRMFDAVNGGPSSVSSQARRKKIEDAMIPLHAALAEAKPFCDPIPF